LRITVAARGEASTTGTMAMNRRAASACSRGEKGCSFLVDIDAAAQDSLACLE
jgi:hypothetical protein